MTVDSRDGVNCESADGYGPQLVTVKDYVTVCETAYLCVYVIDDGAILPASARCPSLC